jgi:hypothetical protein
VLLSRFYYYAKPWLPWRLRIALRRWQARRVRVRCADSWPILDSAGRKPEGWPGWPEGKQFAFVLTHDVESQAGLERVKALAELEISLGFRSAFNFVPEGEYTVPIELRAWLVDNGFEVGVHDLHHDGKLYSSRERFRRCAREINRYLREWGAVGFRSGFMFHKLDWLHDLDILYDSSTFDTDPLEPQPDGVGTIFPFFVPAPVSGQRAGNGLQHHGPQDHGTTGLEQEQSPGPVVPLSRSPVVLSPVVPSSGPSAFSLQPSAFPQSGYIELPCTLPQDHALFVVLGEPTIDIWKQKLDWIAAHGGMAMVDIHPDYVALERDVESDATYSVARYRTLLEYAQDRFPGRFWHALPREVGQFTVKKTLGYGSAVLRGQRAEVRGQKPEEGASVSPPSAVCPPPLVERPPRSVSASAVRRPPSAASRSVVGRPIWIDLDNTPHVPFFLPIIAQLEERGYRVAVTARDAFQVCELADLKGVRYAKIGRHYGKNKAAKVVGLFYRASQLVPFALRERPLVGLSHGARSQIIACNVLRIPSVAIADYEYTKTLPLMRPAWEIVPEAIPAEALHCRKDHVRKYPGIKEDVYAWTLRPDGSVLKELGVQDAELVVVVRPPATEAHYHNPASERLFEAAMERFCRRPGVRMILLPRNKKQGHTIVSRWPAWFSPGRVTIPDRAVDGLNLLWHADLVVSGGGTMNREAAALGVPVYSIFRGKTGAVDRYLEQRGRLVLIRSVEDIDRKIQLVPRQRDAAEVPKPGPALECILGHIEDILRYRGHS